MISPLNLKSDISVFLLRKLVYHFQETVVKYILKKKDIILKEYLYYLTLPPLCSIITE